jgi:hypothetical protein
MPTTAMITGIVEFAHLKNTLPNILLDTKEMGGIEKANALSDLVARAHAIHSNLQVVGHSIQQRVGVVTDILFYSTEAGRNWNFLPRGES